jgi:arsenite-transporting ATPase
MSETRVLLFTGKGGVGKTTLSLATAFRALDFGKKVIVLSSDPAHSLSDALEMKLGPEPVQVEENLFCQEIDVFYTIQKYWGILRNYIINLLKWGKIEEIVAEEITALPGISEIAVFIWVNKLYREKGFDLMIIDCAPTAETLLFLSLPQMGEWWMRKFFPLHRRVTRTLSPLLKRVTDVPLPEDKTYEEVQDLYENLFQVYGILSDPEITSVRLVTNPERMVIEETKRTLTYVELYGYSVDCLIVNRIIPEEENFSGFSKYLEAQKKYLKEIDNSFFPLPIFKVPHLSQEVFGKKLLKQLGEKVYGENDPTQVFFKERPYRISSKDGDYLFEIYLPFARKEEVSVLQYGDELILQVRSERRNIFLPSFLAFYYIKEATLADNWLKVLFCIKKKA